MKTSLGAAGLVALAALAVTAPARALMIAAPPGPMKVAAADAVVVGKVTALADKTEKAEMFKGDTRDLKIATVRVESALLGKLGTTVKVGFVENKPIVGGPGPGGGLRPIRRFPTASLSKDQEALLILVKHPTKKDVYVLQNYYDVVAKKDNPNFKKEVEEAKKAAKVLVNPMAALKSKDADDRLLAAGLVLNRYKTAAAGNTKTEAVPADETKLILTALAEADWSDTKAGRDWSTHPRNLFFRLGATATDGWTQPKDFRMMPEEAKKWLKANAGKFKMTRHVREKAVVETSAEPDK